MKNNNTDSVYHKLQKEIDKMPYGVPESKNGAEIKILKHLFTPEEAEIALYLNIIPETLNKIYRRIKKAGIQIELSKLHETLGKLSKKGAILPGWKDNKKTKRVYSYTLFAIGSYEFQVDRMTKDFYENCEEYLENEFGKEFHKYKFPQMRPVPIGKSIKIEHKIATYDDMRQVIKNTDGQYSVLNCICKQGKDLIGNSCKTSDIRETCIIMPGTSWRYIEFGTARKITKDEALEILERAEDAGLVIQPGNSINPMAICCCCGDCCGILVSAKKFPKPAELFSSNYFAAIDSSKCNGCSICQKRCQMEAITVSDKKASVNLDRCIGCGLCVPKCKPEAVELYKKTKQITPPKTTGEYYKIILQKKLGFWGFLNAALKLLTGKKI